MSRNAHIIRNLDRFLERMEETANRSITLFETSIRDQIMQVTPKDTGALRDSYRFVKIDTDNDEVYYEFSFGDGLVGDDGLPYAAEVHEWYDREINWTTEGTGPGFLLQPVMGNARDLVTIYKLQVQRIRL